MLHKGLRSSGSGSFRMMRHPLEMVTVMRGYKANAAMPGQRRDAARAGA
jgi:hypothetical protein